MTPPIASATPTLYDRDLALKQVRNDYPQANFPDEWPFSQKPETPFTQTFWLTGTGD